MCEWELQDIWAIIKRQNLCIIIIKRDQIHAKRNLFWTKIIEENSLNLEDAHPETRGSQNAE